MGHYIINFSIYTMAMVGLIFFALFVYKKFAINVIATKKRGILSIEDGLGISPRKTLYVIKAGNERFLIAADLDRTTLISKLNSTENLSQTVELDEIDRMNLDTQGINY